MGPRGPGESACESACARARSTRAPRPRHAEGVRLKVIQHALGHADARSTARYARLAPLAPVSAMRLEATPSQVNPFGCIYSEGVVHPWCSPKSPTELLEKD